MIGQVVKTCHRETADDYRGEVWREGRYRITECRDGIQWLFQRQRPGFPGGGAKWDTLGYLHNTERPDAAPPGAYRRGGGGTRRLSRDLQAEGRVMAVAAPSISLPREIASEMSRLARCGFSLIPLGGGDDGKSPLCAFADKPPRLAQTLGLMREYHSTVYGILLADLLVVDADELTPETEALVSARFGPARVQVATPRGRHFWFQHDACDLPNLRAEGLKMDVKAGPTAYVVGPGSIRPDGGEYILILGRLGMSPLSFPHPLRRVARPQTEKAPVGSRHQFLKKQARAYAETVISLDELAANLLHDRDELCETGAEPTPDTEVLKLANWAWSLRTKPGALYEGRRSNFRVEREVIDALVPKPNGDAAFALYSVLASEHGHAPGKRFILSFEGMSGAGLIGFGRDRFRASVRLMLSLGLLRKVGGYVPGRQAQHYQLGRLLKARTDECSGSSVPGGEVL